MEQTTKDRQWIAWLIVVLVTVVGTLLGVRFPIPEPPIDAELPQYGEPGKVSNFTGIHIAAPTVFATATPAMMVDNSGLGRSLEVRDAATPVMYVNNGGTWGSTGNSTHSGGQTINNWSAVSAPTAIATATPAFVVNSAGVSQIA